MSRSKTVYAVINAPFVVGGVHAIVTVLPLCDIVDGDPCDGGPAKTMDTVLFSFVLNFKLNLNSPQHNQTIIISCINYFELMRKI